MSNYYDNFCQTGGSTFTLTAPLDAFVTNGKALPTNSYYGNSQVFRPSYEKKTIPTGTKLYSCPAGDFFILDGNLAAFSLDTRNPNDVGTFEKHFDGTRYALARHFDNGVLKKCDTLTSDAFLSLWNKWREVTAA